MGTSTCSWMSSPSGITVVWIATSSCTVVTVVASSVTTISTVGVSSLTVWVRIAPSGVVTSAISSSSRISTTGLSAEIARIFSSAATLNSTLSPAVIISLDNEISSSEPLVEIAVTALSFDTKATVAVGSSSSISSVSTTTVNSVGGVPSFSESAPRIGLAVMPSTSVPLVGLYRPFAVVIDQSRVADRITKIEPDTLI